MSKVYCDSRFKAIAQANIKVERTDYSFMRIRSNEIHEGKSSEFRHIYIIPSAENETNLVVMVPNKTGLISNANMHESVKNGLKGFEEIASDFE